MGHMPSDEDVENVVAFTGFTDRALILAALQASNNNADKVVNEIFDDKTKFISQYGWDDTAFGANREGTPNSQVPSFAIHAADDNVIQGVDPGYYQGQIGAPSRPPSRTNNRSPLSKLVDLTADSASVPLPNMSIQEREDAELQQAIAASVATSNMQSPQPPQETGVSEADLSQLHFGPANRSDYNQNEWAMVTMNQVRGDPEPARRKRDPGVPAFLRCAMESLWEKHRLGAIITILHAIPAARNALLRAGHAPEIGYGHNPEWWKGKSIVRPVVEDVPETGGDITWTSEPKAVWCEELHRLMAFLDATERSYGNADMLASTQPEGTYSSQDQEKDFYEYMNYGEGCVEKFKVFTSTAAICRIKDVDNPETPPGLNSWGMLEIAQPKEQLMAVDNLYNLLDGIFFSDILTGVDQVGEARIAMITEPADVMAIKFTSNDALPKKIEIPRVFYIDRYLASNKEQILQIQENIWGLKTNLAICDKKEWLCKRMIHPTTGEELDGVPETEQAIQNLRIKISNIRRNAQWVAHNEKAKQTGQEGDYRPNVDIEDDSVQIPYTEGEEKLVKGYWTRIRQLERDLRKVRQRLEQVERYREKWKKMLQNNCAYLTGPSEKEGMTPSHAYTLRGVASSPDIFYVCIRAESDLMEIDDAESSAPKEQWWKLGYVAEDDDQLKAEMTTYEKAMDEACGVGSKPILIYASEKAMGEAPASLSEALKTFVRFDNKLFKQELSKAPTQDNDKKRGGFATPASPSKRRNRSNSWDSIATNAASAGSLDDIRGDDFFSVNDEPNFTEDMPDLIDTSIPDVPPPVRVTSPDFIDGHRSPKPAEASPEPTTSTRQMANSSLDEIVSRGLAERGSRPPVPPRPVKSWTQSQQPASPPIVEHLEFGGGSETKSPEMQERGGTTSPFFNTPKVNGGVSTLDTMDIDDATPTNDHVAPPTPDPKPKV